MSSCLTCQHWAATGGCGLASAIAEVANPRDHLCGKWGPIADDPAAWKSETCETCEFVVPLRPVSGGCYAGGHCIWGPTRECCVDSTSDTENFPDEIVWLPACAQWQRAAATPTNAVRTETNEREVLAELRAAIADAPPTPWAYAGTWIAGDGQERSLDMTVNEAYTKEQRDGDEASV